MTNLLELDALILTRKAWHFEIPQNATKLRLYRQTTVYTMQIKVDWWINEQWVQDDNVENGVIQIRSISLVGAEETRDMAYLEYLKQLTSRWTKEQNAGNCNVTIWSIP